MLSIHGIYDGKQLILDQEIEVTNETEVIVTFLDKSIASKITGHELALLADEFKALGLIDSKEEFLQESIVRTNYAPVPVKRQPVSETMMENRR
ncbi:hypothetical protein H8E77_14165 [bacterium]|nr:hypothetical protein [bacterium]